MRLTGVVEEDEDDDVVDHVDVWYCDRESVAFNIYTNVRNHVVNITTADVTSSTTRIAPAPLLMQSASTSSSLVVFDVVV